MSSGAPLKRDPSHYTLNTRSSNPRRSPFYRQALLFDGTRGRTSLALMRAFNRHIAQIPRYRREQLRPGPIHAFPRQIIIVNASNDRLPLSWETARIARRLLKRLKKKIPVHVVDTKNELWRLARKTGAQTLILSQCVDKKAYNRREALRLRRTLGTVIVPGPITAPGSVLSDKARTYWLFLKKKRRLTLVEPFIRVARKGRGVRPLVNGIFRAMRQLEKTYGVRNFFIKPTEGGGGLGGFRISREGKRFFLPDLSKVSGAFTQVKPSYLTIPLGDTARQDELLWIMDLFRRDPLLKDAYLSISAQSLKKTYRKKSSRAALRAFLAHTQSLHAHLIHSMALEERVVRKHLTKALREFEKKFRRRYIATVNPFISFGTWGLRAHYRLGTKGPVLESLYARIFQLAFTPEGIGYVGSDNISNKQTGKLEVGRLMPLQPVMVRAIGGRRKLFRTLEKGLEALLLIRSGLVPGERSRNPVRVQMDLAPVASRIGEGNADTARGMSLATHWPTFISNAEAWVTDALRYYSYYRAQKQL